jgi:hypothetical protein
MFTMVLGGLLSKHEETKRPILLELRSSKDFVIFVVSFATFTVSWQQGMLSKKKKKHAKTSYVRISCYMDL